MDTQHTFQASISKLDSQTTALSSY
uniref:Uncharacterized protein n=1 Tax=Rhizophora mucronata TaxID=61149 RepID=A0A2P2PM15_RHIMU